MKKERRKRFRRISAMILALAMIISVIPYWPTGIFSIQAEAAQKLSASWSVSDSTIYDSADTEVAVGTALTGQGTLKNTENQVLSIDATSGSFTHRTDGDFNLKAGAVLKVPVVSGAKVCKITLDAYTALSETNIAVSGVTSYSITSGASNWATNTIDCVLDGSTDYVTITFSAQNYFKTLTANSSTSTGSTPAMFNGDNMSAEWSYTGSTLIQSNASTSTTAIQSGATGTYTNATGDVLYIDTTADAENNKGKFAPDGTTQIQVNKATKMTVPVKGDKAVLTLDIYKDNVGTTDTFLTDYVGLTGTSLLKAACSAIEDTDDSNYKKVTVTCYLTGDEGEITLTALTNTYFRSIAVACEELDKVEIKGTITSSTALSEGMKITAVNKTTGVEYSTEITDSAYSIQVPAEDTEMEYELGVSDPEFLISTGVTTHKISTESLSAVTADLKLVKLSTCILTGSISGFAADYDTSDLGLTFTTDAETDYVPEVTVDKNNLTYSAKVEKNVAYDVALTGVNDYEITSTATGISYAEDSTFDITAGKKVMYPVTLTLPQTPDLTGKSVEYIYTNTEDNYVYKFNDRNSISLRNGTYTLSLGGDFLALPYKIKIGSEVTVNGVAAEQTIRYEEITSWSFAVTEDGDYYKDTYQGTTGYYNGLYIDATTGKLAPNGGTPNSAQFNTGAKISIPVSGKCTISVTAFGTSYALYTIGGTAASTENVTSTYQYDSTDAGTVDIVSTGGAYIKSISVVYEAKDVEYVEQTEMPKIYDYGTPDSLVVQPTGQRLMVTQTGGTSGTVDNGDGTYSLNSSVSYYGFDATSDVRKITADVIINECGTSSSNGVFFGAFNDTYIATAGIRKGTELKAIYSKAENNLAAAGSNISGTVALGTTVTFTAEKTDDALVITVTQKNGETQTVEYKYSKDSLLVNENGKASEISYGFVFAGVKATIKNMKYTDASGNILYDQNDCYYVDGLAPVVSSVTAKAAYTRDYITVNWEASREADGDGMYVLQVSKDGAAWTDVDTEITEKSYVYKITDGGSYLFRVCGKLGVNGVNNTFVEAQQLDVVAALKSPVVSISSTVEKVNLSWNAVSEAVKYEVYRYSYDETADNAKLIATVTETAYEDKSVTAEMPYYYYVIAYSSDNCSNPSETVWTVPTKGHTGEYVYEDESAGITITKKSYDTVYNGKITLEGVVEKAASVSLIVNGLKVDEQSVAVRETFAFKDIAVAEGRNDVELLATDSEGNITRETFNFVYLTNYNVVVDAAYTGTDGEAVNGIPTYKTVQKAVDSVSASNTERVVILVKEGDYNEHLQITSPYISLIGEDSTKTRIYFDAKEWVGGDMSLRCAVNVTSKATGFSAENLTFENTYAYLGDGSISNESCDALRNDANDTSYINVRILGYQDTLCTNQGTQYYYKCYIAGNVDYIYGNEPRAFFNDCKLVFRYNANKNSGYVCAPRTSADAGYGLTFYQCQVLAEEGCSGSRYYLARPWGADAYITWIDCYMGKMIKPNVENPYTDMSGNLASEARFFEYGSYGPGYAINVNRRQISKTMADKMITADYLTWDPYTAVTGIGTLYQGSITTEQNDKFVETEYESDSYAGTEGDDTGLGKYALEGYAQASKVTGGGTLKETSDNYYTVGTAEEFLSALLKVKETGMASVIELTNDIALGNKEVNNYADYSSIITAHSNAPLTHPTLLQTGVSMLKLQNMSNLTIYSKNGAKITHTCLDIIGSNNIMIRNIEFDEIWEWDEETEGGYDRNDWDYVTIEKGSADIWIDHCTFYKAYDGVIDIKTPTADSNVTISWCEFLPASEDSVFFDVMMNELKNNASNYPYYSHLLEAGMTEEQIYGYAYGQKKTHLFGQSDSDATAANITVTLANNYYKDSMDRMPRLRYGTAHVYNCIMDAQKLSEIKASISDSSLASKIVSNGASSTCGAHMLLENCYISGVKYPLNSGNGSSPAGYINAVNSLYYLNNVKTELEPKGNSSTDSSVLIENPDEFIAALPYSDYTLYTASDLATKVQPYVGAATLDMTTLQWEKTVYYDNSEDEDDTHTEHTWNAGEVTKAATCTEAGVKTYTCTVCGETKTEVIAATGHNYSTEWTVDKEATCTEAGSKSHHCTVCDDQSEVTEITALGHTWNAGEVTKAATCTEAGVKTYTCTVCSETKTEVIAATGHNYSTEWTVDKEATTTEAGSKSHHCIICGDKTDITEIPVIKEDNTDTDDNTGDNTGDNDEKPGIGDNDEQIEVDVIQNGNVPNTDLSESHQEIINKVLTEEDKAAVAAGKEIKVSLRVENCKDTVSEQETALINSVLTDDQKAGVFLDITLSKQIGEQTSVVTETNSAVRITIEVPENLKNTDSTKTRTYSIVRIHDNKAELLDCEYDEQKNVITFKTDKFSVYAICYQDTAVEENQNNTDNNNGQQNITEQNPDNSTQENNTVVAEKDNNVATGDSVSVMMILAIILLLVISGTVIVVLVVNKKRCNSIR